MLAIGEALRRMWKVAPQQLPFLGGQTTLHRWMIMPRLATPLIGCTQAAATHAAARLYAELQAFCARLPDPPAAQLQDLLWQTPALTPTWWAAAACRTFAFDKFVIPLPFRLSFSAGLHLCLPLHQHGLMVLDAATF
eukprot:353588-Chlamydomonas_euryale.AAC.1